DVPTYLFMKILIRNTSKIRKARIKMISTFLKFIASSPPHHYLILADSKIENNQFRLHQKKKIPKYFRPTGFSLLPHSPVGLDCQNKEINQRPHQIQYK